MKKWNRRLKEFSLFLGLSSLFFIFVLLAVFLFNYYLPGSAALSLNTNPFILLIRWDSFHYLNIITGQEHLLVFFPLYPLVVSYFSIFLPTIFSGFFVSFLSLSTALYFLYKLIKDDFDIEVSQKSLALMLLFPTSIFFTLIYTESLFLALIVSFFYFLHKKKWLTAAIIGFFAALTRNVGIFLWAVYIVAILIEYYPRFLKRKETWLSLLIPLGLITYCIYCYFVSGDFLAFITGQKAWSEIHIFLWPGEVIWRLFKYHIFAPINEISLYDHIRIVVIEAGSFFLLLIATIYWFIKKRWTYATFCALNLILFSCMYPMTSVNRYVVVIFPIFIFLAKITVKRNWIFYSLLALFALFLIFNIYLISAGAWIG